MFPAKNNLAPDGTGLAYTLTTTETEGVAVVGWEPDPVAVSAEEALAAHERQADSRRESEVEASAEWLRDDLDKGPLPRRELVRRARDAGMSRASARRAQHVLGVQPQKAGVGPWLWVPAP